MFCGGRYGYIVPLDLDLCHPIDPHRNSLAGVNLRGVDINGQQFQGQNIHFLNDRNDERATTFDDPKPSGLNRPIQIRKGVFATGNDQHLIRPHLRVTAGPDRHQNDDDCYNAKNSHRDGPELCDTSKHAIHSLFCRFVGDNLTRFNIKL